MVVRRRHIEEPTKVCDILRTRLCKAAAQLAKPRDLRHVAGRQAVDQGLAHRIKSLFCLGVAESGAGLEHCDPVLLVQKHHVFLL